MLYFNTNLSIFKNTSRIIGWLSYGLLNNTILEQNGLRLSFYTYQFCDLYDNYLVKTRSTIDLLEQVVSLYQQANTSCSLQIQSLTAQLHLRLEKAEALLSQVQTIADHLLTLLQSPTSLRNTYHIIQESRLMLSTFEIELKYVPQLYFETLKLLRHIWYDYETSLLLNK